MKRDIVIYNDEGVGAFGLSCLKEFFKEDDVWLCNAEAVIDGSVLGMADIFVMPGGADLPYVKKLNGQGNANIRTFVETGGTYLGICAGAYYACSSLEFHKGRADEICDARELALLEAIAIGSIPEIAPPFKDHLSSAAITKVNGIPVFYFGGPFFNTTEKVVGLYDAVNQPAIIRRSLGEGSVLLSGVHFEVTADLLEKYPTDDPAEKKIALELAEYLRKSSPFDWNDYLLGVKE